MSTFPQVIKGNLLLKKPTAGSGTYGVGILGFTGGATNEHAIRISTNLAKALKVVDSAGVHT